MTAALPTTVEVQRRTFIVAAVAFVAYVFAVPSGFAFDDNPVLLQSAVIQGTVPLHEVLFRDWWGHLPAETVGSYRPLATLALWCDWHVGTWFSASFSGWLAHHAPTWVEWDHGAARGWPMHFVNVVLHAFAMSLVYRVLRRMVPESVALGAALIWAVAAAPSEVVDGLVGRADLLETIGLVGGLWAHRRKGRAAAILAMGCLLLAVGTKETGVLAVVAWPMMDVFLPGDVPWSRRLGRFAGYAVVLAVYFAFRRVAVGTLHLPQTRLSLFNPLRDAAVGARVFGAGRIFVERYVLGLIDPRRRLYDCSAQACTTSAPADVVAWAGIALFALFVISPLVAWRRAPVAAAGLAWAVLFFAPVVNFFFPATLTYGERLLYVPMFGLSLAVAEAARRIGRVGWIALAVVLTLNFVALQLRHPDWRSGAALAASGLRYAPDSVVVLENNADAAINRKDYPAAESFASRAIALVPEDGYSHNELAVSYFYEGRLPDAEREFRQSLKFERATELVVNFVHFLAKQGRFAEALAEVERQTREHPDDPALPRLAARLRLASGSRP